MSANIINLRDRQQHQRKSEARLNGASKMPASLDAKIEQLSEQHDALLRAAEKLTETIAILSGLGVAGSAIVSAKVDISQQRAETAAFFYRELGKRLQIAQRVLQLSDLEIANAMGASVRCRDFLRSR
jgi:hypothetical protein